MGIHACAGWHAEGGENAEGTGKSELRSDWGAEACPFKVAETENRQGWEDGKQADGGVGRGPGGPPHQACMNEWGGGKGRGKVRLFGGSDAIAVDLGGDGTLEEIDGDDDAEGAFFGADDETLDAGQGAAANAHPLAGGEVRPGDEEGLSGDEGSEIFELTGEDGGGGVAHADNLADAGHL